MAVSTRLIRRRVSSTRSTKKIMKAMELGAASKMRKTTLLTLGTRPYSNLIRDLTHQVRKLTDPRAYRLLVGTPVKAGQPCRTLAIVVASDRGLCGGFNAQLTRFALEFLHQRPGDQINLVTVGKRAATVGKRGNFPLAASFDAISNAPSFARAKPIADLALQEFLSGRVDRVFIVYMQFKSAMTQTPVKYQLLPIVPEGELPADSQEQTEDEEESEGKQSVERTEQSALFEPTPDEILNKLLPRMLEMQVYQALLESSASEHGARMMAMRSAGDAATEMLDDLTLTLNQARQSTITREISEISAGKAAIE